MTTTQPSTATDRRILRELARQVRAIADLPEMSARRERWVRHNALQGGRPMVLCFPEGSWIELLPPEALRCEDEFHLIMERGLRSRLYWWEHIRDDSFIEPWFDLGWHVSTTSYGFDVPYTYGDHRGSYVWDAPIKDLSRGLDQLRPRTFGVDRQATQRDAERAAALFGDILPVRVHAGLWWTVGLTWEAVKLVGIEQLMIAMCDEPENVHRLMAFLRDDTARFIDWCEAEGLLAPNDGADYVGSGGVGATGELRRADDAETRGRGDAANSASPRPSDSASPRQPPAIRLRDRWGFAESQETVGVSPSMFVEFVLPYQAPLLDRFGLNYYGCCEGLETRIDPILERVPRLRRVSVAPSANQEVMAEKLAGRYIFCRKPYPAHVCVGFNEDAIRADLRRTLDLAGDGPLELILKDTHTVEGEPWRITRWVEIAYEEIERLTDAHVHAGA